MPRQRIDHGRIVYVLPEDFPERLRRLLDESGLPRTEVARRLGVTPYTIWRWVEGGVRPHVRHQMALLALAQELGLARLLTAWTLPDEEQVSSSPQPIPPRRRG